MKELARKISEEQAKQMQELHKEGYSYVALADQFGVSASAIGYHLSPKVKEGCLRRNKKYAKAHPDAGKETRKAYMESDRGKRSVAKSYLRMYLRRKIVTKEDVLEVMEEFP